MFTAKPPYVNQRGLVAVFYFIKKNEHMNDKENKIIALFMGLKPHHQDAGYLIDESKDEGYEAIHESCFLYGSSWDWLMPVVESCYHNGADSNEIGDITHALLDCDIDATHKAVVEFIKTYNDER